jgi:hypothetical protein
VEIGYLGSRSHRLERMFDANEVTPGPAACRTGRPYPEFTKIQEIGNVAEARYNSMALKLTRRLDQGLSLAGRLYALEVRGQRQRHPRPQRRRALPADSNCFDCEWGLSIFDVRHRFVRRSSTSCRSGRASRWRRTAWRRRARRLADQRDRQQVERLPARSRGRHRHPQHGSQTYRPNLVSGQDPNDGAKTIQQWFNTAAFARPDAFTYGNAGATSSSAPASSRPTRR